MNPFDAIRDSKKKKDKKQWEMIDMDKIAQETGKVAFFQLNLCKFLPAE